MEIFSRFTQDGPYPARIEWFDDAVFAIIGMRVSGRPATSAFGCADTVVPSGEMR